MTHRLGCCADAVPSAFGRNTTDRGHSFAGLLLLVTLLCTLTLPTIVAAQNISSGQVVGTITDPQGAEVPGAEITMIDRSTKQQYKTTTNADGHFAFPNAAPGTYDIKVTKSGFKTATVQGQVVEIGKMLTENVAMQVGQVEQTVTVETTGTELQTMNATVGDVVSGIALESLPAVGRDVSTFAVMQPGVAPDGSVAGTVVDQASFSLDGGQNSNDMDGSMTVYTGSFANSPGGFAAGSTPSGVIPTPIDSIEEFKVNTVGQTADFNSSSGMQVLMQTKHGTNNFHGTVYEYYLDNNWNANTWQNKDHAGTPADPITKQPDYHYSRFGGSFGGPLLPGSYLGGKTYFFAFYEGFRFPNSETYARIVPTATMRAGIIQIKDATTNTISVYNLNPNAVTVNGTTYAGSGTTLDPRGLGLNPLVAQLWSHDPLPNAACSGLSRCDGLNIGRFEANLALPQKSDLGVFRIDHDFGDKWRFNGTYHYYRLTNANDSQVDIGGLLPGDKLGVPSAKSQNPQLPWLYTAGLTTQFSSTLTNDFHYSFTRNWWAWSRAGDVPQLPGLGGAIEPLGESKLQSLVPYNVNTQQTRTRYWDGLDHYFRDDVSILRGNHFIQVGGIYQHNYNQHARTDNGGGINYQPVYQLATTSNAGISGVPVSGSTFSRDYAAILGIVSVSQQAFTRTGSNLALNPPLTPAFDQSTIPFYNIYGSDSWRITPHITLTYGLGWTVEMPPTEKNGKQVLFVDGNNKPIDTEQYLKAREQAALSGQVYNPTVGFSLINNVAGKPKYPYNPYYKEFSPRIAVAWNPHFDRDSFLGGITGGDKTVVRGGYGRIFGRLNGVDLVLVPLLGTGLIQPVQCLGPQTTGCPTSTSGATNPMNAFRIGVDGLTAPLATPQPTLPQPFFPGVGGNTEAGAGEALDPNFRPNVVDSFTLSVQRQLSNKMIVELGYIGRRITHEYLPININAVPYMFTKGGQRFDNAYASLEKASNFGNNIVCSVPVPTGQTCHGAGGIFTIAGGVPSQPFFESALSGTGFCNSYANCTSAVVDKQAANLESQDVWHLWSALDHGAFNFAPTMLNNTGQLSSGVGLNASLGYGNYNAGYVSFRINDWKGITFQNNFTWSKALGTGALVQATSEYTADDPFDLHRMYGLQAFDRKFVYNAFAVFQSPFYRSQQGFLGRLLGGWSLAPVFQAGSGVPVESFTVNGGGAAFGEGDSINFFSNENAIPTSMSGVSNSAHYGVVGTTAANSGHVNIFSNPDAVFANLRQPILGLDRNDGGVGILRGLPFWNLDLSVRKNIRVAERFSVEGQVMFINVLNHMQFADPSFDTSSPGSFGVLDTQGNSPRQMEFGLRFRF